MLDCVQVGFLMGDMQDVDYILSVVNSFPLPCSYYRVISDERRTLVIRTIIRSPHAGIAMLEQTNVAVQCLRLFNVINLFRTTGLTSSLVTHAHLFAVSPCHPAVLLATSAEAFPQPRS